MSELTTRIQEILDQQRDINEKINGKTLLHEAASNNDTEAIILLTNNGADKEATDENERTPLHLAALNGQTQAVISLIDNGANKEATDENEQTPLHLAALNGQTQAVISLIDNGANKEATDENEQTPLHLAALNGQTQAVISLIDNGANKEATDENEQTPLHLAALNGQTQAVISLIDNGANKETTDENEQTPLHLAFSSNSLEVMKLLIDQGASMNARDEDGHTPSDIGNIKALIDYILIKDPQAQKHEFFNEPQNIELSKYFDECKIQIGELKKHIILEDNTRELKNTLYDLISLEVKNPYLSDYLDRKKCLESMNKYTKTCSDHINGLIYKKYIAKAFIELRNEQLAKNKFTTLAKASVKSQDSKINTLEINQIFSRLNENDKTKLAKAFYQAPKTEELNPKKRDRKRSNTI